MSDVPEEITVGVDGTTLPVVELLTGRGFGHRQIRQRQIKHRERAL
jgi:hypothetical protein